MPVMIPPDVPRDQPSLSDAEIDVFDALKKQLPDDWIVLHSLWLKNHPRKLHAEIDFIVVGDKSILLLEIKGGIVCREITGWRFTTKSGSHSSIKREGPFDQVRGAYYAVKQHLQSIGKLSLFHDYVWGYAVIIPECMPKIPGTDTSIEIRLLLDQGGFPGHLWNFLQDVTAYWTDKYRLLKENIGPRAMTLHRTIPVQVRREIVSCLRPDFECIKGLGSWTLNIEREILKLTEEQCTALDYAESEERNILIGAAGTGKTILAFEQAKRQAGKGKKVLFTCFNRLLAKWIEENTKQIGDMRGVHVANYHKLMVSLIMEAGMRANVPEDWDSFNRNIDEIALDALDRLGGSDRYDYLIMVRWIRFFWTRD